MAISWKKLLLLPLGAALLMTAGCGEKPEEAARKPQVVEQMVQNSVEVCQAGTINATGAQYEARLREVLNDVRTTKLETLRDNNITVCLDQRLPQQERSFWHTSIKGVFYNTALPTAKGGVLAIYDTGVQPGQGSMWELDTYDWGSRTVGHFADKVQQGSITPQSGNWYAYTYTTSSGKSSSTHLGWREGARFDQWTLSHNPQLQQAPVKTPAPVTPAPRAPGS